jgi:hypothetical protein
MANASSDSRPAAGRRAGARRRHTTIGLRGCTALAIALLALACLVAPAGADVGEKIIERCTHGQSLSGFSQQAYRRALAELPTEVEEYSDCGNLIRQAQLAALGKNGGPGGGGGPIAPAPITPQERAALSHASKAGAAPLSVGNKLVHPGVVHANVSSALSSLPDPVLALLALLLACALALSGRSIYHGVRAWRAD